MIFDFLDIAGRNAGFFSQFFIGQLLVGSGFLQTESHFLVNFLAIYAPLCIVYIAHFTFEMH